MPEEKSTKIEKTAEKQQTGNVKPAAVIYLGPAIAGVATPGTVYRNGLTPQIRDVIKELPEMNRLLVSTKYAVRMRKELKDPQSAASICYQNVLAYAKQKGAKG